MSIHPYQLKVDEELVTIYQMVFWELPNIKKPFETETLCVIGLIIICHIIADLAKLCFICLERTLEKRERKNVELFLLINLL